MNKLEQAARSVLERFKRKESDPEITNVESLLKPGNIEKLVAQHRTPIRLDSIRGLNGKMLPYYQVPPKNYNPGKIDHVYTSHGGVHIYVGKDGVQRIGTTYILTEEQAEQVETRIKKEKSRLTSDKTR